MKSRVVAVAMGAVSLLGAAACGSSGGTGAAPATTIKLGTASYQTLAPILTSPPTTGTVAGGGGVIPGEQQYTVLGGDALYVITKKFCITPDLLIQFNGWTEGTAHKLFAGDKIKIPPGACAPGTAATTAPASGSEVTTAATVAETTTTFSAATGATYEVQANDTLSRIAGKTGTTVDAIVAANGWTDGDKHLIYPGLKIKMPAKTG